MTGDPCGGNVTGGAGCKCAPLFGSLPTVPPPADDTGRALDFTMTRFLAVVAENERLRQAITLIRAEWVVGLATTEAAGLDAPATKAAARKIISQLDKVLT